MNTRGGARTHKGEWVRGVLPYKEKRKEKRRKKTTQVGGKAPLHPMSLLAF